MSIYQSDMNNEFKRYATFSGFPSPDGVWPTQLARSGFYRSGECGEFEVVCFACGLKLDLRTVSGIPVAEVHRRLVPDCSFLAGSSNNQPVPPVNPEAAEEWLRQNFSFEFDTAYEADSTGQGNGNLPNMPVSGGWESVPIELPDLPDSSVVMNQIVSQLPSLSDLSTLEMGQPQSENLPSLPMDFLDGFANATLDSVPTRQLFDGPTQHQFGSRLGGPGEVLVTDGVSDGTEGDFPPNAMPDSQANDFNNRPQQPQPQPQVPSNEESLEVEVAEAGIPQKLTFFDLGIITQRPKRPDFVTVQSRLATFQNWNGPRISQSKTDIAEAGFYYAGYTDCCRCFYCGGGLKSWDPEDNPWVEHARWFPACPFILTNKGQEFVHAVESLSRTCNNVAGVRMADVENEIRHMRSESCRGLNNVEILESEMEMEEQNAVELQAENLENDDTEADRLTDENLSLRQPDMCKICYEAEVGVLYVPCGHLVTCGTCASTVRLCPICRQVVGGQIRIQRDDS